MPNIDWKVGDIVELAGRRGKIVASVEDEQNFGQLARVKWDDGRTGTVDLHGFPDAKRIEPEVRFSKAQVEHALTDAARLRPPSPFDGPGRW